MARLLPVLASIALIFLFSCGAPSGDRQPTADDPAATTEEGAPAEVAAEDESVELDSIRDPMTIGIPETYHSWSDREALNYTERLNPPRGDLLEGGERIILRMPAAEERIHVTSKWRGIYCPFCEVELGSFLLEMPNITRVAIAPEDGVWPHETELEVALNLRDTSLPARTFRIETGPAPRLRNPESWIGRRFVTEVVIHPPILCFVGPCDFRMRMELEIVDLVPGESVQFRFTPCQRFTAGTLPSEDCAEETVEWPVAPLRGDTGMFEVAMPLDRFQRSDQPNVDPETGMGFYSRVSGELLQETIQFLHVEIYFLDHNEEEQSQVGWYFGKTDPVIDGP